jgi:hypothetical protein
MPDGKRKRRHSQNKAKQHWYAFSRAVRFARRFGGTQVASSVTNVNYRSRFGGM